MAEHAESTSPPPRIAVGVLAYNEEPRIADTLASIFEQDLFARFDVELIVVPNGCQDATAARAEQAIEAARSTWQARGTARVVELQEAGKSNAWTQFVHELSGKDADLLMLVDADIKLLQPDTLSRLVTALQDDPRAVISIDQPVKDIALRDKPGLRDRLFLSATPPVNPNNLPLCGQLYCARADELRTFQLPAGIQVEDGFIRAMLLTQRFTAAEDPKRIVLAEGASHSFEAIKGIGEAMRHERRIVSGSIINFMLFERFTSAQDEERDAGRLIAKWHAQDPHWLAALVREQVNVRGWRLLPRDWWMRRWHRLRGLSFGKKLKKLPIAMAAWAMDVWVFVAGIRDVRSGKAFRYWGR